MDWLGGWLKELILIIMLAAFAELLLPNNNMQRYARTVIGLFLLLTILSPILELFQRGLDAGKLLSAADAWQLESAAVSGSTGAGANGMKPVDTVKKDGAKLQNANIEQARRLVEAQLAEGIKEGIEGSQGTSVDSVQATVKVDERGKASLESVRVTLGQSSPKNGERSGTGIEPVKPVEIRIEPKGRTVPAQAQQQPASGTGVSESTRRAVSEYIQSAWQLAPERISVTAGAAAK
ncbi:stage III sporulation protein AF [Paenibacillus sp. MBLB4367]|uniref:stage III sporulation protein AF n=1 Tax=Paenibacillus sp. MBLB4367 TaxID=3384767 RepID=UPI0039083B4D